MRENAYQNNSEYGHFFTQFDVGELPLEKYEFILQREEFPLN